MKIKINYGYRAVCLPASVADCIAKATKKDIEILFKLLSGGYLYKDGELDLDAFSGELGYKSADVENSLNFWRRTGIIADNAETGPADPVELGNVEQHKVLKPQSAPPRYSTTDITNVLNGRGELPGLIDECQNIFGKVFNPHEVGVIVSLIDYLGVSGDYILVLISYCKRIGKISMYLVEKLAYEMYNDGIYSAKELEDRLMAKELAASIEGKVRRLFGIKDRALTTKEMQLIASWASVLKYDIKVIKHAYEITVDSIKEASLPYANAILEKWNSLGLRTLDDIKKYETERRGTVSSDAKNIKLGVSFDTDEFFEAALKRSLGEDDE